MIPTFTLLALALLALWLGDDDRMAVARRSFWLLLFVASLASALLYGVVEPVALGWVAALALAAFAYSRPRAGRRQVATAAIVILALAAGLMLHRLPGFHNPCILAAVRFTPDAIPFTLYLNYDKALIGLFLLGWCHPRIARVRDWRAMLATAAPWAGGLIALILALSLAAGYVRFEPKFPAAAAQWAGVNLLFVCVAEEALFRGFIQAQLQRAWQRVPGGPWLALGVAAVLFGLAHAAGGVTYVALATVAGLGYGWIYQRTQRIEASILTHFALNTVHFFAFTYPALQQAGAG